MLTLLHIQIIAAHNKTIYPAAPKAREKRREKRRVVLSWSLAAFRAHGGGVYRN